MARLGMVRRVVSRSIRALAGAALVLGAVVGAPTGSVASAAPASAAPTPQTALILAPSVYEPAGPGSSLEQQDLQSQGWTVTEIDGPTWASEPQAYFAGFQLLVLGDPFCSPSISTIQDAINNEPTWAPVVNGSILTIGTDPAYHN